MPALADKWLDFALFVCVQNATDADFLFRYPLYFFDHIYICYNAVRVIIPAVSPVLFCGWMTEDERSFWIGFRVGWGRALYIMMSSHTQIGSEFKNWKQIGWQNQARSQDLKSGGSFLVSAERRISVCDPTIPARGSGGRCKPPSRVRGRAPEANAFSHQSIENWLKRSLASKKVGGGGHLLRPHQAEKWLSFQGYHLHCYLLHFPDQMVHQKLDWNANTNAHNYVGPILICY